ncbi:Uncharacterised protein [uncultured archaeon]|nr:Uncharacterised protein [uncultured archaeon]
MRAKKAQVSAETMLVFLIFLILLGIAYHATTRIGTGAQGKIESVLSRNSFNNFAAKVEEACQLGNGNVRIAEIQGDPATIVSDGRSFTFTAKGFSAGANSSCNIDVIQNQPAKSFRIENEQGTVKVS